MFTCFYAVLFARGLGGSLFLDIKILASSLHKVLAYFPRIKKEQTVILHVQALKSCESFVKL